MRKKTDDENEKEVNKTTNKVLNSPYIDVNNSFSLGLITNIFKLVKCFGSP